MIARHKLVHVITQWDHAEAAKAKRRGYWHNIYALSIMLGALHDAEEDVVDGVPVRSALMRYFNGR